MEKKRGASRLYLESGQRALLGAALTLALLLSPPLEAADLVPDLSKLPPVEGRTVQKARLENGLEAYLISEPEAKQSAAALSVARGSWSDPEASPGLAHFLEHLLFLGTEAYPGEASYDLFVKEHGGEANAYTRDQDTTYVYQIDSPALEESLKRFSQFFISPLLSGPGASRELEALHQEFQGKKGEEETRQLFLLKELANPSHPWSRLAVGNRETLSKVSVDKVRAWFQEHYSADAMHLVIYSPHPIEKQLEWVERYFSPIERRSSAPSLPLQPIITDELAGHLVLMEPLRDQNSLTLYWELPRELSFDMEARPDLLAAYLLGDEGQGSLLSQLKREELAEGIVSGSRHLLGGRTLFLIRADLTEKGVKNPYQVIERCFQAIAFYREHPLPKDFFDDLNRLSLLRHLFHSKKPPEEEVLAHAWALHLEPLESYPRKSSLIDLYDAELLQALFASLTPKSCRILLSAKPKHTKIRQPDFFERWMGIPYSIRKIPEELFRSWEEATPLPSLDFPELSPFVPKKIREEALTSPSSGRPSLLVKEELGSLYFASERSYPAPTSYLALRIETPSLCLDSPRTIALADLYVEAFKEAVNELLYPALEADFSYEIKREEEAIQLMLYGWSETFGSTLSLLLEQLKEPRLPLSRLMQLKEKLKREALNFASEPAYQRGFDLLKELLYSRYSREKERAAAFASLQESDYRQFLKELFLRSKTTALLYGGFSEEAARSLWKELQERLQSLPYREKKRRAVEAVSLSEKEPYSLDCRIKAHANALLLLLAAGSSSPEDLAISETAAQMIAPLFFDALRTRQQTGYFVTSGLLEVKERAFQLFLIESRSHGPRDLLARSEQLIEAFLRDLKEQPAYRSRFESVKEALANKLDSPFSSLKERGDHLARLAFEHSGDFERRKKRAEALRSLHYEEFLERAEALYGKANRGRLALLVHGSEAKSALRYRRAKGLRWLHQKLWNLP